MKSLQVSSNTEPLNTYVSSSDTLLLCKMNMNTLALSEKLISF